MRNVVQPIIPGTQISPYTPLVHSFCPTKYLVPTFAVHQKHRGEPPNITRRLRAYNIVIPLRPYEVPIGVAVGLPPTPHFHDLVNRVGERGLEADGTTPWSS